MSSAQVKSTVLCMIAAALIAAPAVAEKPAWAANGKKGAASDQRDSGKGKAPVRADNDRRTTVVVQTHFVDRHRVVVRDYYVQEHGAGRCPPGLAKKNNGCMPPGLAKKWQVGRPLPRDVIFHDLPPRLVIELGTPPAGHRYVRVAADILLIAIGTGMVIDAIQDLGRM